jgi:SAM-dependent methyltransferase
MTGNPDFHRAPISGIAKCAVPHCPACGSIAREQILEVREHEYSTTTEDVFPLKACTDCGAWYLDPRPDASALPIIYPPNYFAYVLESRAGGDPETARKGAFAALRNWLYKRRVAPIARHVELGPQIRWLDIGCGDGAILDAMRAAYGMIGTGIDLSEKSVALCRAAGYEAHVSRFEDYSPAPGESYHLVHSSHVIEHVESPLGYMQKAWDLLEPGGLNVFITPNSNVWEARLLGRNWGGLHVPRHWTLLNPHSARALGERIGFEHLETSFSTNAGFWNYSAHAVCMNLFGRNAADRLFAADHRLIESSLWNLAKGAAFTALDTLNVLLFRSSANMLVIFRKPA